MAHVPVTTGLGHSIEPTPCLTGETYFAGPLWDTSSIYVSSYNCDDDVASHCMCTSLHACLVCVFVCVCVCACACVYVCACACVCVFKLYAYMHVCMYVHVQL